MRLSVEETRRLFSGIDPETLATAGISVDHLQRIAFNAQYMADYQVRAGTPLAGAGVEALTRRFAGNMLNQALRARGALDVELASTSGPARRPIGDSRGIDSRTPGIAAGLGAVSQAVAAFQPAGRDDLIALIEGAARDPAMREMHLKNLAGAGRVTRELDEGVIRLYARDGLESLQGNQLMALAGNPHNLARFARLWAA